MPRFHRPPTAAKLKSIVEKFNREFPVGTNCTLRKDSESVETCVRAPAEVMGGHSAVAWFVGVSGAYSIEDDRVSAR